MTNCKGEHSKAVTTVQTPKQTGRWLAASDNVHPSPTDVLLRRLLALGEAG